MGAPSLFNWKVITRFPSGEVSFCCAFAMNEIQSKAIINKFFFILSMVLNCKLINSSFQVFCIRNIANVKTILASSVN